MDQPWRGSRQSLALSISEAAKICGVKRRTIRRRHQAGDFEHAFRDPDGTWRIPVYDLVAAGLRPPVVPDPDEPRIVFSAASQVDRLRTEVAILRERVRALEIIAKEREERVTDLRTILRMLPAPKVADEAAPPRAEEPLPPTLDVEEEPLEQEVREQPASEEVREAPAPRRPSVAGETPSPVRVSSPFDSPASPAASNEPIVILPDVSSEEPEPPEGALERSAELLETARRRSAELLEDAMALWWPSPATGGQPDAAPSAARRPGPPAAKPASAPAQASTTVSDEALVGATLTGETVASPPVERAQPPQAPRSEPPSESELFTPLPIDEASFDWLDPDFGRPPKHLRHRFDRFLRRRWRAR
ncbi:MAG TPA: helix-turn-helix domain-containing protein [Actinomycetota bacterium]|nr:helix-turn-helix domain-containing protein [Actinomycetota bacterium]